MTLMKSSLVLGMVVATATVVAAFAPNAKTTTPQPYRPFICKATATATTATTTTTTSSLPMIGGSSSTPDDNRDVNAANSKSANEGASSYRPRHLPSSEDTKLSSSQASYRGLDGILPLPQIHHSETRQMRIQNEEEIKSRFLQGEAIISNRDHISALKLSLKSSLGDFAKMQKIKAEIRDRVSVDAELVYKNCLQRAELAMEEGMMEEVRRWRAEGVEARGCLPQFQLEGLWVGKYGPYGYEMINVTYVGDTLIATKITGDKNVPKGEITFTADLSPISASSSSRLEPIQLTEAAAKQWGTTQLPRFPGHGQVAAEGFVNNQMVDGQLILVGAYFSFAWVPVGHQIFFGRPSAELTLKMLKRNKMVEYGADDGGDAKTTSSEKMAEMRAFADRCLEETEMLEDDPEEDQIVFSSDHENYYSQDGCFE